MNNKKNLSPEQQKVIDDESKYLSVFATAGSGKTFTLIQKAKNILTKNEKNILVVSFTKSTVKELKKKFFGFKKLPNIRTFDSFFIETFFEFYHLDELFINGIYLDKNKIDTATDKPKIDNEKDFIDEIISNKKLQISSKFFKAEIMPRIFSKNSTMNILSCMYSHILIDESQDMDVYQLNFLERVIKYGKIKIVAFGDYHQSIYR